MKVLFSFFLIFSLSVAHGHDHDNAQQGQVALVIHAGAGTIERDKLSAEDEQRIRATLMQALEVGEARLNAGASSVDAVIAAIQVLEEAPDFNAGRGAVFNAEGEHELDASLMRGQDRGAGAVAGVTGVKSPISLALAVMNQSPHVMLAGDGAEIFAREQGIEFAPPEYFHTDYRWQQLERARQASVSTPDHWYSTVGAVALDQAGNLAAGTSTGGMTNKKYGRVGDSPIIGAGTWADNDSCGVSATGHGEYFIRSAVAYSICARVQFAGLDVTSAAEAVVLKELPDMGGTGGVIAMDAEGNIAMPFNTPGMYRGALFTDGRKQVAIFADE
jgi:beta-aspartyl-peptidase (threonine type)